MTNTTRTMDTNMIDGKVIKGQCLCGAVQVEAVIAFDGLTVCHCDMCRRWAGGPFVAVQSESVSFDVAGDALATYTSSDWAERGFCKTCGIKSFYIPRSNQDGFAVTWRCLDDWMDLDVTINRFDGQNWEANAAALAHKSRD